jgi:hypothetical protein
MGACDRKRFGVWSNCRTALMTHMQSTVYSNSTSLVVGGDAEAPAAAEISAVGGNAWVGESAESSPP